MLVLAVAAAVLAAVPVWYDVVELPAACLAVEPGHGSAVELVHAAE